MGIKNEFLNFLAGAFTIGLIYLIINLAVLLVPNPNFWLITILLLLIWICWLAGRLLFGWLLD